MTEVLVVIGAVISFITFYRIGQYIALRQLEKKFRNGK